MLEYLIAAGPHGNQTPDENFTAAWQEISKAAKKRRGKVEVVITGATTDDDVKEQAITQVEEALPESVQGQHTVHRIGKIEETPAVYAPNQDGSITVTTPGTYLQRGGTDAYCAIIHIARPMLASELEIALNRGIGVYKRGTNDEGLEIAPLVEKWMGFQ